MRQFRRYCDAANAAISVRGVAMNVVKPIAIGSADTSSEIEAAGNVHELARADAAFRQDEGRGEGGDHEISVSSLDTLLRRLSESSTREIENLIAELQKLRRKLQTDGSRVQRDIADYTELSQQVMQLTKIISDSVKKFPSAAGVGA
jgi:hypothetical protein